jgi:hypothetical protein
VVLGMRAELLVPAFKSIHGMVALMVILPRRLVYAEMEKSKYICSSCDRCKSRRYNRTSDLSGRTTKQ